jgi:hypothetical protein
MGLLAFRLGSFILGSPIIPNTHILTKGVSYYGLAIYIKMYLKAKEGLWKGKYFTIQNIIFKKSSKRNQNPSSIITL